MVNEMKARRIVLVAFATLGLFALSGSNGFSATLWGEKRESRILERWIEGRWPKATEVFVNCPATKSARAEERCEFRLVDRRQVQQGQAVIDLDDVSPQLLPPAPQSARECPGDWNAGPHQQLLRLQGKGIRCYLVLAYGSSIAESLNRRKTVPKGFTAAATGSLRHGFVINRFSCTARSRDVAGSAEAVSREVGFRCGNRFGDEFLYVYNGR